MNKDKNYFYSLRNHTSKKNGIKYFKLRGKIHQSRILYPEKLSSKSEGK